MTLRELTRFLLTTTTHASTGLMQDQEDESSGLQGSHGDYIDGPSTSTSTAPLKSQRLIQQAVLTLVQHNICWHVCIMSDGTIAETTGVDASRGTEYFQINVDEVLPRLRFGAYLVIAEEEFGTEASEVVNILLQNGKLRARDVKEIFGASEDEHKVERIRVALRDLLYWAYIKPSIPKLYASPRDRRISYETEEMRLSKKMLTPKEKSEIAVNAGKRLEADQMSVWKSGGERRGLIPCRKKRVANGKGQKLKVVKKAKISNGKSRSVELALDDDNSEGEVDEIREKLEVDSEVFLQVNFDRFDVHIRDEIILEAVEKRYNKTFAEVLQAMMQTSVKMGEAIPSTKMEKSPAIHITNIRQYLPKGIALKKAFDRDAIRGLLGSDPAQSVLLGEVIAVLLDAGDISRKGLSKRLVSPGAGVSEPTIGPAGAKIPSLLHIEFGNAARVLRDQLLGNVVEAQFGPTGTRIMTLLRSMGKLEEKHISKLTLMPMGEARDVCGRLFASSLLSLQEVPKGSERTPQRTIYFWYVNERKCTAWLCDHLFKTLSRLSQRRRQELAKEAELISKMERIKLAQDASTTTTTTSNLLTEMEKYRLNKVQETVSVITLGEIRAWRDLFVVLQLPE